jgi:hypothetical protein
VLNYDQNGTNLVSHLRSNYAFRLPRAAFPGLGNRDLQASALFVKCRTDPHPDGSVSHFHLQITASGLCEEMFGKGARSCGEYPTQQ